MSSSRDFQARLRAALELDFPYAERPTGGDGGRAAAILALFADLDADPAVLLTLRTDLVETHKGQVAFPGGVSDPEDFDQDGPLTTALRETEEEVGIPRAEIEIVGKMPDLLTSTGFRITPVVGLLARESSRIELRPNPHEIAEVFWAPLGLLLAPGTYSREMYEWKGLRHPIHVFQVGPHRVWGVTGAILKNLLDRLETARPL